MKVMLWHVATDNPNGKRRALTIDVTPELNAKLEERARARPRRWTDIEAILQPYLPEGCHLVAIQTAQEKTNGKANR